MQCDGAGVFDVELPLEVCFANARPGTTVRMVDGTGLGPPNPNAGVATAVLAVSPANRSGRKRRLRSSIVSCNPCGTNATDLGIAVFGGIAALGGEVTASLQGRSLRAYIRLGPAVTDELVYSLARGLDG